MADFETDLQGLEAIQRRPVVPRNTLAQVGAILGGFGAGLGIGNPVLEQFERQRDRELKEQLELIRVQQAVQQNRQQKQKFEVDIARDLIQIGGPAALMGGQMLRGYLQNAGYQTPPGFIEGLTAQTFTMKDIEDIHNAKVFKVPLENIRANKPKMDPTLVELIYKTPLNDFMRRALNLPTEVEDASKRLDVETKTMDLLQKEQAAKYPELTLDKKFAEQIEIQHLKGTQKHYIDGTPQTQQAARDAAAAAIREDKISVAAALGGARQGEIIATEKTGGSFYDKQTGEYKVAIKQGELLANPTRFASLSQQEMQSAGLMKRGIEQNQRLRQLTPQVLASAPGKNIANFLRSEARLYTGASPMLREWLALVTEENIELARALGPGQFRVRLLEVIAKDTGPQLSMDTVRTALTLIDVRALTLENALRGLHQLSILRNDQRIGPGTWWAIDKTSGKRVPIRLEPYEVSDDKYSIIEVR